MLTHNTPKHPTPKWLKSWRTLVGVLFLLVAVYLLARGWHTVTHSIRIARRAHPAWLLGALGFMISTQLIAAGIYGVLAINKLKYLQTVLIEIAAGFVNRVLPSGLGSLGLHGAYLYKRKHTVAEATAVVSINNLLGITAHLFLLALLATLEPHVVRGLHMKHGVMYFTWFVGLAVVVGLLLLSTSLRPRFVRFICNLLVSLRKVGACSVLEAFVLAVFLTSCYTAVLFCSAHAVGIHMSVLRVFIVFTVGMFSGTVVPLPGGLVGAEAGLLVGFVTYGVPTVQAGAVVLIFRLVTYWLPIVPGIVALLVARRRQII